MEVSYMLVRVLDLNKNTWILTVGLILLIALIQTFQASINRIKMAAREKKRIWKKLNWPTSPHSWLEWNSNLLSPSKSRRSNACSVCLTTLVSHKSCGRKTATVQIRASCDFGLYGKIVLSPLSDEEICEGREVSNGGVTNKSRRQRQSKTRTWNPGFGGSGTAIPEEKKYEIVNLCNDARPLLVFINAKSGAQNGSTLRRKLNTLLNPIQVFELSSTEGPELGFEMFKNIKDFKILVCGGDGTVTWVLQAIEKLNLNSPPPVAILPLGTGNDLSRVLNWGGGLSSALQKGGICKLLDDIDCATIMQLDRWNVEIKEDFGKNLKFMTNYLSVGCDAKVAYEFHCAREERPHLFYNQFMNKLIYAKEGAKDMIDRSCDDLPWHVSLQVDGTIVEIPEDTEGIIVLNIASYMGGVDLWRNKNINHDANFGLQSMNDKTLEVLCITGTLHLGKIQVGLSRAKRLAQGKSISLDLHRSFPVQVDGEPWIQPPGSLEITHRCQVSMLKRPLTNNS